MVSTPELKKYTDKTLLITLNNNRLIQGKLIGFDIFMNLNLTDAVELIQKTNKNNRQKVPSNNEAVKVGSCVIRGNSVVSVEVLGN